MAQTTTAINACNAIIEVDNVGGTPVDVSGETNNANTTLSIDTATFNTFAGGWAGRLQCKKDGAVDMNIIWTTTAAQARELFEDWFDTAGSRTVSIYPNGTGTGERVYTGEFVLTELSFPLDGSSADAIVIAATIEPNGEIFLNTAA